MNFMKYLSNFFLFSLSLLTACSQKTSNTPKDVAENKENENTLLWKISGNGLTKPSYLFGTMHMLCADDAVLSNNLKNAIAECDDVYLEVDMDNMMEMFGALGKMKMRGDTTLKDLLSESEYEKVKKYFNDIFYNKEKGYDIIFDKSAAFFIDEKYDITAEIIKGLNARYNKVETKK